MTRVAKYKKTFNQKSIYEEKRTSQVDREEQKLIEESKQQTVEEVQSSRQHRSKPVDTLNSFVYALIGVPPMPQTRTLGQILPAWRGEYML